MICTPLRTLLPVTETSLLLLIGVAAVTAADPAAFQLVQTIELKGKPGKLDHLTLDAKHDRLLLANKVNNTLDVIDLKAGKLLKQIPNQSGVQGVAYAPDVDRVFAALDLGAEAGFGDDQLHLGRLVAGQVR